ncbi:hypothetical protein [Flavobacterium sp. GP15]|uniref:hypothetical protein n=1 Tax=Flavobacterium sp. GP15 TaxID=2758567 RepID=UPI00165DA069|nr:hypothetical protein [Flavobacterium sp. GP15]
MKISEVKIGQKIDHGEKGEGIVIAKTPRTITAKFPKVTTKVTYRFKDAIFSPIDF